MSAPSAKSFSTCCARTRGPAGKTLAVLAAVLLLAAVAAAAAKKKKKPSDPEDLFNPLLGIDYSHWLVGPIAEIATAEEIEAYLLLASDEGAARFIESFWDGRAEGLGFFDKKPRRIFEERAAEADKRFSEGAVPGRQTDRGKILILYGEPEEITFETPRQAHVPTLEVWEYPKDAEEGLDKKTPKRGYRFVRIDDSKVLYTNQKIRRDPLDRDREFGRRPPG